MAIYGVDLYAKSYYGIDTPIQFTVDPFRANQYEHGKLSITWTTPRQVSAPNAAGKAWSSLRLIRNLYGFPVNATDGAIILEVPNTAPVQSFNDLTAPVGRFAYYAIYVLTTHDAWDATRNYNVGDQVTYLTVNYVAIANSINATPGISSSWSTSSTATEWVYAGATIGLVVADWKYSEFLYAHTPRAYKVNVIETTGSNPDFNNALWKFDEIFGFGFDIIKTENDALLQVNNIEMTRDKYVLALAEQMGIGEELPDEPLLRRERLIDATKISRQKGSLAGLHTLVKDTTGWDSTINLGYNMLLDIDQASFGHPILPVWDAQTRYYSTNPNISTNEIVRYAGAPYQCLLSNTGVVPNTIGTPPSAAAPDYWKTVPTLTLPYTWRGWWTSTTDYAVNDVVVLNGATTTFYQATVVSGPNRGGPLTPGVSGWFGTANLPGATPSTSYAGPFNAATAYAINTLVMSAAWPNGSAWITTAAIPTTNPYWRTFGPPYSDISGPQNTPAIYNWTTHGLSTWTAYPQGKTTTVPMTLWVDAIAASGSNPPRNCINIFNNDSSSSVVVARSVSPTFYDYWNTSVAARVGMVVTFRGVNYVCTENITGGTVTPDLDSQHWTLYGPVPGELLATRQGVPIPRARPWDHNRTYVAGDKVSVTGNIYQATFSTTGVSPSGYQFDSRGWRWIGPEQGIYTASIYYERLAPTASSQVSTRIDWYGPQNNFLFSMGIGTWPTLFDHFSTDGPIGGTDPVTYPVVAQFSNPFPITWIDAGGPWRVDNNVVHTVYPPTRVSHQILAMSENQYGSSPGTDFMGLFVTFVSAPQDPNREQGIIFNLDTTARTYWMASRTRLTKNTYNAAFTTTTITPVGTPWTYIADGRRLRLTKNGQVFAGYVAAGLGTETNIFTVSDTFSSTGTLHGVGERPMS